MNRDDIIRMAREAGLTVQSPSWGYTEHYHFAGFEQPFERFAALVAAAEREACARVCEEVTAAWTQHVYNEGVMDCVKAIRARGEV